MGSKIASLQYSPHLINPSQNTDLQQNKHLSLIAFLEEKSQKGAKTHFH
jgi:hypothetical protein